MTSHWKTKLDGYSPTKDLRILRHKDGMYLAEREDGTGIIAHKFDVLLLQVKKEL